MHVTYMQVPIRLKGLEATEYPRSVVAGGYELSSVGCWEVNLGPLEGQQL